MFSSSSFFPFFPIRRWISGAGGGIGGGAQMALREAGIQLYGGVSGDADAAVDALLKDELICNLNVHCNHHGAHHHGKCGEHGCGNH